MNRDEEGVDMEKIPFIAMLYTLNGERKEFRCDFPSEFLKEFETANQSDYEVAFFFLMGRDQTDVKTLGDAIKVCKG